MGPSNNPAPEGRLPSGSTTIRDLSQDYLLQWGELQAEHVGQFTSVLVLPLALGLLVWVLDLPRWLRSRAGDPIAPLRLLVLVSIPLGLERLAVIWAQWTELPYVGTPALLALALLASAILLSCASEILEDNKKPVGFPLSAAMWATQIQLKRVFAPGQALHELSDHAPAWVRVLTNIGVGFRVLSRALLVVAGGPAQAVSMLGVPLYGIAAPAFFVGGGITQNYMLGGTAEGPILVGVLVATGGVLWLIYRKGIPILGEWLYQGELAERTARSRRFGGAIFVAYFTLLTMAIGQIGLIDWAPAGALLQVQRLSDALAATGLLWPLFLYYALFYSLAFGIYEALFDPDAEDFATV